MAVFFDKNALVKTKCMHIVLLLSITLHKEGRGWYWIKQVWWAVEVILVVIMQIAVTVVAGKCAVNGLQNKRTV